jgi:hypothetical protein
MGYKNLKNEELVNLITMLVSLPLLYRSLSPLLCLLELLTFSGQSENKFNFFYSISTFFKPSMTIWVSDSAAEIIFSFFLLYINWDINPHAYFSQKKLIFMIC